ncbi:hypothetical protein GcM1_141002 [Golovinomyces cichoracearum]|uniref:Uncharacterized protein n=1 Tax=Golovinomyces cichoracearum TaxID=62708 RepID=A0A420JBM0_9PEZI|nr:hypothetical protein GcM1_141002 [Golovinomyces cichoracearum]
MARKAQVAYKTLSLVREDRLNPDDIQDDIEDVAGVFTRDDIDNDTIEENPFIGVSPSYTEGTGSQTPEAHARKRRSEFSNNSHKKQRVSVLNMMEKIRNEMIAFRRP